MQKRTTALARAAGAALLVGALAATSACSSAAAPPSADSAITWAIAATNLEAGHMDPHRSQLDSSGYVARLSLDSLVYVDQAGEMHPWLASAWAVEDGGTRVTFELRDDVTFHDGTPFNAEAVAANFAHIMAEETASAQAAAMLGGEQYLGTEVLGEFSVAVTFAQPFVPFLNNASTPFLGMYSPQTLADNAEQLKAGGPGITVGSGPYRMTELVPKDHISFERNADYAWAPESVALPEQPAPAIEIEIVPESSVRVQALNSGEADIATGFAPGDVRELSESLTVTNIESPGIPYALFLNEQNGVLGDLAVRRAFRSALDIDAAVEATFFGELNRAWSVLSPTTPNAYDPALEGSWPQDRAGAIALLEGAGWTEVGADGIRSKDGERLSVNWSAWTPVSNENGALAALFEDDLRQVGIELVHEAVEPGEYNERYGSGAFDVTDWSFASVDPDALRAHLHSDGFQNASHVSVPELDALLERAAAEGDPAARAASYREAQQWNDENVAIVPVYLPALIGAQRAELRGMATDAYGWPNFTAATFVGE